MTKRILVLATAAALAACSSGSGGGGGSNDPAPAKPTGLTATPGYAQVALDWAENVESDLDHYAVYRWQGGGTPALVATVQAPAHAYTATALVNGQSYTFALSAVDARGHASARSDPASATPFDAVPAKPAGVVATAGTGLVALSWTASTEPDLAYYEIYRWESWPPSLVATVAAPAVSYQDAGVVNGTWYSFYVRVLDLAGQASQPSDVVMARPDTAAQLVSHDGYGPIVVGTVAQNTGLGINTWNDGGLSTGPVSITITGPDAAYFTTTNACGPIPGGGVCSNYLDFVGTTMRPYSATLTASASPGGSFSRDVTVTRGYEVKVAQVYGFPSGWVVSSPPGIVCGGSSWQCSKIFGADDWVTLTVSINNGSQALFTGWTGEGSAACPGASRICALPQAYAYLTPTYTWDLNHNVAFVSSASYPTNLTQAQYDGYCNDLARAAGLNSFTGGAYPLFVAWVSTASEAAPARLASAVTGIGSGAWQAWLRVDGSPLADTQADVAAGRFYHPLSLDEWGRPVGAAVFTETKADGTWSSGYSCSTGTYGTVGRSDAGPGGWTDWSSYGCGGAQRIYCFSRGRTTALGTVATVVGKKMWTTKAAMTRGTGGLAALDAFCQANKPASVVTAKAFAATATQAASDRLSAGATYVSITGQLIATGADFQANRLPLQTGPWVYEDGSYPAASFQSMFISGALQMNQPGTDQTTCSSWTTTGAGPYTILGTSASAGAWFFNGGSTGCSQARSLLCFEE